MKRDILIVLDAALIFAVVLFQNPEFFYNECTEVPDAGLVIIDGSLYRNISYTVDIKWFSKTIETKRVYNVYEKAKKHALPSSSFRCRIGVDGQTIHKTSVSQRAIDASELAAFGMLLAVCMVGIKALTRQKSLYESLYRFCAYLFVFIPLFVLSSGFETSCLKISEAASLHRDGEIWVDAKYTIKASFFGVFWPYKMGPFSYSFPHDEALPDFFACRYNETPPGIVRVFETITDDEVYRLRILLLLQVVCVLFGLFTPQEPDQTTGSEGPEKKSEQTNLPPPQTTDFHIVSGQEKTSRPRTVDILKDLPDVLSESAHTSAEDTRDDTV